MRIILVPLGSHGDVHPFVGLGTALRSRGHEVVVIANPYFASLITSRGLPYQPLGTAAEYESAISDPDLWHPRRAARVVGRFALPLVEPLYRMICREEGANTVVVAPGLAFGARLAQERLGIRLVTVHLQPVVFWSDHATPVLSGVRLPPWFPRLAKRVLKWAMDRELCVSFGRALDRVRGDLGLEPLPAPLLDWWNSPDRIVGLFPDVFAPPQPDWPRQVVLTGFPLFDESDALVPDPAVAAWLADRPPPIVFTPGSANRHAGRFLATAVKVCRRLGRRGVLLTRFGSHLPRCLPAEVRHFHYLPLSFVLHHAAALVHHGGVGTFSQAAALGVPQLIVPQAHDQFDNADRARRLGIAATLPSERFTPRSAAAKLVTLMESENVGVRCRAFSAAVRAAPGLEAACRAIESLKKGDATG